MKNICGIPVSFSERNVKPEEMEYPYYHNKIDEENIHIIDELEADYKRRQGNLVLGLAPRTSEGEKRTTDRSSVL